MIHETNNGISYDKFTGIVTISTDWWDTQYGCTVVSATNQILETYIKVDRVIIEPSRVIRLLIANQPQTISRTCTFTSNGNLLVELICKNQGVSLSQANFYTTMIEA